MAEDLVAAAESLQAELRADSASIEAARRLPDGWSDRLAKAGFYRMLVPESVGGLEVHPAEYAGAVEALAVGDGSAAWVSFIAATSGSALAYLPEASGREIFSAPDVMLAGVFAPRGRAVAGEGGFRVDGRWQWGSGTQNADWVMGGCVIVRDGEAERLPNGAPRSRMMVVPRDEIEFFDTWDVSGLCGTGSTDFAMNDVFVPESRAVGLLGDRPAARPLYAFPNLGLLAMGIAGVALGLARAAIDELCAFAGDKTPTGSAKSLASRPAAQADVARAEAMLRSSRSWFYETIEAAWDSATGEGSIPVDQKRDLRLATAHATRESAKAVDLMYDLAGGTSVYRRSPLQRIFRDVHVATQHMMVAPPVLELTGRLFLGLETDVSFL